MVHPAPRWDGAKRPRQLPFNSFRVIHLSGCYPAVLLDIARFNFFCNCFNNNSLLARLPLIGVVSSFMTILTRNTIYRTRRASSTSGTTYTYPKLAPP